MKLAVLDPLAGGGAGLKPTGRAMVLFCALVLGPKNCINICGVSNCETPESPTPPFSGAGSGPAGWFGSGAGGCATRGWVWADIGFLAEVFAAGALVLGGTTSGAGEDGSASAIGRAGKR